MDGAFVSPGLLASPAEDNAKKKAPGSPLGPFSLGARDASLLFDSELPLRQGEHDHHHQQVREGLAGNPGRRRGEGYGDLGGAFQVECCPVTRNGKDGKVREKNAFLAACDAAPQGGVDRGQVYTAWTGAEIARDGAAELLECSMKGFQLFTPVRRKGKDNLPRSIGQRPRARMDGVLRVADAGAFAALLARGVGRHRAFGLGMMLLRPV